MAGPLDGIADIVTGRLKRMARARAQVAALYGVAVLFIVITLVALLAAGSIALSSVVGPFVASLIVALVACLFGLVFLIVASSRTRAAREREAREAQAQRQTLGLILTALPVLKSRDTLLLAVAVGILVGFMTGGKKPDDNA